MLKQSEHWKYNQPLTKLLSSVETCLVNKTNLVFFIVVKRSIIV